MSPLLFFAVIMITFLGCTKEKIAKEIEEKSIEKPKMIISITEFCPFMCPKKTNKGFTVEIVDKIFKDQNIKIKFHEYPWARGVSQTTNGKIYGILAPGKDEAPKLIYPNEPIAIQKNCFFSKKTNGWKYKSKESLKSIKLLAFIGWAHGKELKKYLGEDKYRSIFTELSYDGQYYERVSKMIKKGKADAFWADPNVIGYFNLKQDSLFKDFKNSGCISSHFLYIGFTPIDRSKSFEFIKIIDNGIKKLRESKELQKILTKYNVNDWANEKEILFH